MNSKFKLHEFTGVHKSSLVFTWVHVYNKINV